MKFHRRGRLKQLAPYAGQVVTSSRHVVTAKNAWVAKLLHHRGTLLQQRTRGSQSCYIIEARCYSKERVDRKVVTSSRHVVTAKNAWVAKLLHHRGTLLQQRTRGLQSCYIIEARCYSKERVGRKASVTRTCFDINWLMLTYTSYTQCS